VWLSNRNEPAHELLGGIDKFRVADVSAIYVSGIARSQFRKVSQEQLNIGKILNSLVELSEEHDEKLLGSYGKSILSLGKRIMLKHCPSWWSPWKNAVDLIHEKAKVLFVYVVMPYGAKFTRVTSGAEINLVVSCEQCIFQQQPLTWSSALFQNRNRELRDKPRFGGLILKTGVDVKTVFGIRPG
jgi:hypothetical protein